MPRLLVFLLALLAATADRALSNPVVNEAAGRVDRVIVVHEGELLGSESRVIAALQKQLSTMSSRPLLLTEASPAEKAAAMPWLAASLPSIPAAWPEPWKDAQTVVVLQVLAPRGKKPQRTSGGLGGRLVFRAPEKAPVYVERIEGTQGASLDAESLAKWLRGALKIAAVKESR
ncbi:MAG: hypothetical protein JNJ46_13260 [Myxococcales bacterium]|nr:hypothetical protein [Myxococcales bacterium]